MLEIEKRAVYYDDTYHTGWIGMQQAKVVRDFLNSEGFKILNADELREWMLKIIENSIGHTVVVFSQDRAPDTVLDDSSANALIRQFLDAGGKIVWMGDIPFWNIGKKGIGDKEQAELDKVWWKNGASIQVLGVIPVMSTPSESVHFTIAGRMMGLTTVWTGIRPVLKDKGIIALAESRSLIATPLIQYEEKWRLPQVRRIELSVSPSIELVPPEQKARERFGKTYANAWFKNFNENDTSSGFIRLWDYAPRILTSRMKYDLLKCCR